MKVKILSKTVCVAAQVTEWNQDRESNSFSVACSNSTEQYPSVGMWVGKFPEIFYVIFPEISEKNGSTFPEKFYLKILQICGR